MMKWIRFQPPGSGDGAVGHRPAGRARRAAQEQPQVPAGDVGERGRGVEPDREPEVRRVEVDGRGDVVDHVADVDGVLIDHDVLLVLRGDRARRAGARCGSRARRRSARTRGRWPRRRPRRRPGSGMLQCAVLGAARELGAHLPHPVAQRDRRSRSGCGRSGAGASGVPGEVDRPARPSPARRSGAAAWDDCLRCEPGRCDPTGARGAPRPSGTGRCCPCTGTAPASCDRGAAATAGRRRAGAPVGPQHPPRHTCCRAPIEIRSGSRCRVRRPSSGATSPGPRRAARAGGTRRGSAARRPARVSSLTRRSLSASSDSDPPAKRIAEEP